MSRLRVLIILLCALVIAGCEGSPTEKVEPARYTLYGLAELNLDDDNDYLYLEFKADDLPVAGSFAVVGNDTLVFDASGVISAASPDIVWNFNSDVAITVYDTAGDFAHTEVVRMPGDFSIFDLALPDGVYQGKTVQVEWAGSADAKGYFVTCVPDAADSPARGFAEDIGLEGTELSIGPATFQQRLYPFDRVEDSFYVFVVAYNPTYEPRPEAEYVNTPPFDELVFSSSVGAPNIAGTFGAAVVSKREVIYVVTQ